MMKPILVTCVYDARSDWLLGGKDNDEELYETSLDSSNCELSILQPNNIYRN